MKRTLFLFLIAICFSPTVPALGQANGACASVDLLARLDSLNATYQQSRSTVDKTDTQAILKLASDLEANLQTLISGCQHASIATEEATAAATEQAHDGLTRATAFALGETGPTMDGKGTLVINRFVRGATSANASFLRNQRPGTGQEWLIVNVTFTCKQSLCDRLQDQTFYLVGDQKLLYSHLHYTDGGLFTDQLSGSALLDGKLTGWLWFRVPTTETNLVLGDDSAVPHFFSLTRVSTNGEKVTVAAPGIVNIRSCAGTQCAVIGRASNGDQLILVEDLGEWLHIRGLDGSDGYISATLVQKP